MRTREVVQYEVHGEDLGLTGLEPYITRDREKAAKMEAMIQASADDGRLALAMSDQHVYGRNGVAYPHEYRLRSGYSEPFWGAYCGQLPADTVEKLVGRCEHLAKLLSLGSRQAALAIEAATTGELGTLKTFIVQVVRSEDGVGFLEMIGVGFSEADAREAVKEWQPGWSFYRDGLHLVHPSGARCRVEITPYHD